MGEVRIEQRDRVLIATLDNPPHGLFDAGLVQGLEGLAERADSDDGVGAVVLTGGHASRFIAHYDVAEILAGTDGPEIGRRGAAAAVRTVGALRRVPGADRALSKSPVSGVVNLERFHALLLKMNRSGAVFVAALNGSAMGGGCELALACDLRLMAEGDHRIGQPEILLGFPPGGGGTQRLARLLGPRLALRLVLEGQAVSPEEALELGLVDELAAADTLIERAVAAAAHLGARPKHAVAACKRLIYEAGEQPLASGLQAERAEFLAAAGHPAAAEAMTAYLDRFEQTGELPAYDREAMQQAVDKGRFGV